MKDSAVDDEVVERLGKMLSDGNLRGTAKGYAEHLYRKLSRPVRISIMGTAGTGKSELVNLFLGQELMPRDAVLPTAEFVWGDTGRMTVTAADGSVSKVHSTDLSTLSGRNAAFLQVELPVDTLRRVNLLEVVADGGVEELRSGVNWALQRTDIAVWCTQDFSPLERQIWSSVPDGIKDHAFLILTKADVLSAQRMLSVRVGELQDVVAEEFHSMFAVATLQALRARAEAGADSDLFRASGAEALLNGVMGHAQRGRRADLDSAHAFVARSETGGETQRVKSRIRSQMISPPRTVSEQIAADPAANPAPADPQPETNEPSAAQPAKPAGPPKVENIALFSDAVRFLRRRGDSLAETLAGLEAGDTKPMIEHCVEAVEHLTDLFSQDETGCEAADAFIDELAEATDVMVLMQVEDGDGPAADAVTLLLQLRHDMEMQLAA